MDTQTNKANNSTSVIDLPIRRHLEESWLLLKKSLYPVFLVSVISYTGIILTIILGAVLFFVFIISNKQLNKQLDALFNSAAPSVINHAAPNLQIIITALKTAAPIFLLVMGILMMFSIASSAAYLLVLDRSDDKKGALSIFLEGIKLTPTLFIYNLFVSWIVIGGAVFFILPGMIFNFLLVFGIYEIILKRRGILAAIARSVEIIRANFGFIFFRSLLIWLLSVAVSALLSSLFGNKESVGYYLIFQFIFSVFYGWYAMAYAMVLYKYVEGSTPVNERFRPTAIYLISFIGWLLIIAIGYLIYSKFGGQIYQFFNRPIVKNKQELTKTVDFISFVPSNCGLSIPLPQTAIKERHWIYEERFVSPDSFYNFAPINTKNGGALGAFLAFKKESERYKAEQTTYNISYPGLNIYCVNNLDGLGIDEFVDLAEKNTNFSFKKESKKERWGDVEVNSVIIEGVSSKGDYFKENLFLGVTADRRRLFFIRLRFPYQDESAQAIVNDITALLNSLKYRETDML